MRHGTAHLVASSISPHQARATLLTSAHRCQWARSQVRREEEKHAREVAWLHGECGEMQAEIGELVVAGNERGACVSTLHAALAEADEEVAAHEARLAGEATGIQMNPEQVCMQLAS